MSKNARLNVDIDQKLFRDIKIQAANDNCTLRTVVIAALVQYLEARDKR